MSWSSILIIGCSNIIANALSMGIGEYLSSKAHRDFVQTEKRREQWEFKNYKEGEIKEMINIFEERGMGRADAELVVRKMADYDTFFINMMVTEELGLQIPDDDEALLLKDSFIMFVSFAGFGLIPLLVYFFAPLHLLEEEFLFLLSATLSACILFILGSTKSLFRCAFVFILIFQFYFFHTTFALITFLS